MSDTKKLLKRSEVPVDDTWAMEDLFATDEMWQKAYEEMPGLIAGYENYKGKLAESADVLYNCLTYNDMVEEKLENIYVYARQKLDEDTTNGKYQDFASKAQSIAAKLGSAAAFIMPEILAIEESRLSAFLKVDNGILHYQRLLDEINRKRKHSLNSTMEELLADSAEMASSTSQIFSMFNNADIQFPEITGADGNPVKITQGRYVSLLESENRTVREDAFKAFHKTYASYKNMLAASFSGNIKQAIFYSKARNYPSTRAYYLSDSNVPEAVYDNLIKTVHEYLPLLHRYVKIRKKALGLSELHMYDLYTPMISGIEKQISFEEGKQMITAGLKPLGERYLNVLAEGFSNRWIDVRENVGKRTGAYSWGAYGTHPYVLMNYQDTLDNVFTLAHEMGHALHSYFSDAAQSYTYAGYKIFVAEVASTCNESLLIHDLLAKSNDNREKSYLVNNFLEKFRGTLFRQTMFAEFEMLTHRMVENGETLTAESLCQLYLDLNKKYFGEEIIVDEEIGIEWARIPHFYTPFYVYQYATGFSAAIALSRSILAGEAGAVERYMEFLSGGGSKDSIDLLKGAGVDMSHKKPIQDAMELFEQLLEELEQIM